MKVYIPLAAAVLAAGVAGALPAAENAVPQPQPAGKTGFREGRRPVKTGTDSDAGKVDPTPVKATVESLLDLPRPLDLGTSEANPEYEDRRAPGETTVWTLEAVIVAHQLMPDGDFRLVLEGSSGKRLVIELPDPKLAGPNSRWAKEITAVRKQFEDRFHPTKEQHETKTRARITGIGFFGRTNPRGAPDNVSGIRLQPALKIEWVSEPGSKPAPGKSNGKV